MVKALKFWSWCYIYFMCFKHCSDVSLNGGTFNFYNDLLRCFKLVNSFLLWLKLIGLHQLLGLLSMTLSNENVEQELNWYYSGTLNELNALNESINVVHCCQSPLNFEISIGSSFIALNCKWCVKYEGLMMLIAALPSWSMICIKLTLMSHSCSLNFIRISSSSRQALQSEFQTFQMFLKY